MSERPFSISAVRLSAVDMEDQTCRITTETSNASLMDSIERVGLMSPPLLIPKKTESNAEGMQSPCFTIVCGFRRIAVCQDLGWSDIEARVLGPDTASSDCVKFAIGDNALQRSLNLIETSRSLCLLAEVFKADELVSMAKVFETLRLSLSKQREVITLVREIAIREDISILDVLHGDHLQEILGDDDLDRNQKARSVRLYLRQRRFPAITHAERAFERHVRDLKLGNQMKLIPPANFEGNVYTLSMCFSNLAELKSLRTSFDQLIRNPSLEKILS
ncbi:MAG: hypothetical protein B6245_17170 [Desulfobacteraceae bacterium 4572_88]|nr:MAG: hypothetical protein B6245_17170 [Desulfobacteraceae bacterium 4572_88]